MEHEIKEIFDIFKMNINFKRQFTKNSTRISKLQCSSVEIYTNSIQRQHSHPPFLAQLQMSTVHFHPSYDVLKTWCPQEGRANRFFKRE